MNDLSVGKVADFLVTKPDDTFPQIDGLVIKTARGLRFAPIDTVADVDRHGTVALTATPAEPAPSDDQALYLISDLLDKQIVDVDGRKVVRINDIEVASTGGRMRVVAADVGVAGLLRRLGLKSFGRRFTPGVYRAVPRSMIAWSSVSPIRESNPTPSAPLGQDRANWRGCIPRNSPRSSATSRRAKPLRSSDNSTTRPPPTRSSISIQRRKRR